MPMMTQVSGLNQGAVMQDQTQAGSGAITRRLTFQPVKAGKYSRGASLPEGYPVSVRPAPGGGYVLLADVDGPADYTATVSADAVALAPASS